MSQESSQSSSTGTVKRKTDNDICAISKKASKMETNDDVEDFDSSMDLAPSLQSNNVACSESSNDSQASKQSGCNNFNSRIPESKPTTANAESLMSSALSKKDSIYASGHSMDSVFKLVNTVNNHMSVDEAPISRPMKMKVDNHELDSPLSPTIPQNTYNHFTTFTDRPIKKERNETIVSGSLREQYVSQSVIKPIPENNVIPLIPNDFLKKRSLNIPNLSNSSDKGMSNGNAENTKQKRIDQIKKEIEETASLFLNENSNSDEGEIELLLTFPKQYL